MGQSIEDIANAAGVTVDEIRSLVNHERKCLDCEHVWEYTGDADRPTCPQCKGKRTESIE